MRHGHADGTRPHRGIVHDEARHEVLIFPTGHSILETRSDQLVAGPRAAIPRAVQSSKGIPAVLRGELIAVVDDHSH